MSGELLLSMRQAVGRTEQLWRIWILLSALVLGVGNFCTLVTSRYLVWQSWSGCSISLSLAKSQIATLGLMYLSYNLHVCGLWHLLITDYVYDRWKVNFLVLLMPSVSSSIGGLVVLLICSGKWWWKSLEIRLVYF